MLQSLNVAPRATLHAVLTTIIAGTQAWLPGAVFGVEPVEMHGHVRCLQGEAVTSEDADEDPCNRPGARFVFETLNGRSFDLIAGDPKAGMFIDPRVRLRDLSLRGWVRPRDSFEILSVFSIVEGERRHVHYRCDVCDITASAPGPCWCCGADFELREVPVDRLEK